MPLTIPPPLATCISKLQLVFESIKEEKQLTQESDLAPFTKKTGERDYIDTLSKKNSTYSDNASLILDFFVFKFPNIVTESLGNESTWDETKAYAALMIKLQKYCFPAIDYWDKDKHVPRITSERLYTKACYFLWILESVKNWKDSQTKEDLGSISRSIIVKLVDVKIPPLKERLETYEKKHDVNEKYSYEAIDQKLNDLVVAKEKEVKAPSLLQSSSSLFASPSSPALAVAANAAVIQDDKKVNTPTVRQG